VKDPAKRNSEIEKIRLRAVQWRRVDQRASQKGGTAGQKSSH
jgi:hypothetical protein